MVFEKIIVLNYGKVTAYSKYNRQQTTFLYLIIEGFPFARNIMF